MAEPPRALLYMMLWPHFSLVIPPGSATTGTLMGPQLCLNGRLSVLRGKRPCREGADAARLDEFGRQENLDQIPGYGRSYPPAAHTNNVHLVVLDTLPGREAVVDQTGTDARNFVGTNRRAHATTADRDAAFYFPAGYRLSQRNDEVGIVVAGYQRNSPGVNYLVPRCNVHQLPDARYSSGNGGSAGF